MSTIIDPRETSWYARRGLSRSPSRARKRDSFLPGPSKRDSFRLNTNSNKRASARSSLYSHYPPMPSSRPTSWARDRKYTSTSEYEALFSALAAPTILEDDLVLTDYSSKLKRESYWSDKKAGTITTRGSQETKMSGGSGFSTGTAASAMSAKSSARYNPFDPRSHELRARLKARFFRNHR